MFKSTHNLEFEVAEWHTHEFKLFRIGSVEGLCGVDAKSYIIVAVTNSKPGNGHLNDVFDWFENSCKQDGKTLKIVEIMNTDFLFHLINKRGFTKIVGNNCEKYFDEKVVDIPKSDKGIAKSKVVITK